MNVLDTIRCAWHRDCAAFGARLAGGQPSRVLKGETVVEARLSRGRTSVLDTTQVCETAQPISLPLPCERGAVIVGPVLAGLLNEGGTGTQECGLRFAPQVTLSALR